MGEKESRGGDRVEGEGLERARILLKVEGNRICHDTAGCTISLAD